jgi:predicted ester cyclase
MSEENKTLVRRIVEDYWSKKNPSLAGELFGANCSIHTPDVDLQGMEGATLLYDVFSTAFPDFRITIDDTVAEGEQVAIRHTFAGTHNGPFGETPASGNRVTVSGMMLFRVVGGKVAEARLTWDTLKLQQQVGALPKASGQAAP